jgi:acyl-coenzyme A thioesterase PaaI-like protein
MALETQTLDVRAAALRAVPQNRCFACGPDHAHGLRIRYQLDDAGAVTAEWVPLPDWEGFTGIIHGGIVATVLDEAMSKVVSASKCEALTGELRVRFRHHVSSGETLQIRGWIVKRSKRLITTEATLIAGDGAERAHAWARFLAIPRLHA